MLKAALFAGVTIALCGFAPDEDFDKAVAKAGEMGKYAFKVTITNENRPPEGGSSVNTMPPFECKVDKDVAVEIKGPQGGSAYKKSDVLVYKDKEGNWKKFERRRDQPKEPPPEGGEEGGRPEGGRPPREFGMHMRAMMTASHLPNETLKDIGGKLKEVKKADAKENDCTVYTADLTEEGAKELSRPGPGGREGREGKEGEGINVAVTGSAKFWVNGEGNIVKFEISTAVKGKIRDREIDHKTTISTEISEIGTATVELPDEVKKLFEEQK